MRVKNCGKWIEVKSLAEVSRIIRETISEVLRLSMYIFYGDMVSGVKAEERPARSQLPAAVKRREKYMKDNYANVNDLMAETKDGSVLEFRTVWEA